eukprot:4792840-Amphidinium_carterae.1
MTVKLRSLSLRLMSFFGGVGKHGLVGRPNRVVWLSYVGIVRRGHGCGPVLHRLPNRESVATAGA